MRARVRVCVCVDCIKVTTGVQSYDWLFQCIESFGCKHTRLLAGFISAGNLIGNLFRNVGSVKQNLNISKGKAKQIQISQK